MMFVLLSGFTRVFPYRCRRGGWWVVWAAPSLVDGSKDSPGALSDQKKAELLCLFKKSMK